MKKRWWEDKEWRGVPPQRETFGEEEDELRRRKLKSEGGCKARARRGEQDEKRGRQRAEDRGVERMTDSGSSGEREERSEKVGAAHSLPTVLH